MSKAIVQKVLAVVVIVGTALTTGTFWWLVLSVESEKPVGVPVRSASVPREESDGNTGGALPTLPELKHTPCHPQFHVEPYLQYPTPTSISILWETKEALPGVVEYGEKETLGQSITEMGPARTMHEVRLTGLKPATLYYYRVRSGEAVSPVYTFRTAPPAGAKRWRIAIYGDSRSNPATHRAIAEQILRQGVELVVHTGDMVSNGKNHSAWAREFFAPLAPLACRVPIMGVLGNHEADSPLYFSYFALPGNERYYLFEYGNARFVCLDSNMGEGKVAWAKEQEKWLEEQLRQLDDSTWNFVVFHQPLFSAHATRPISPLRWRWTPQLLTHTVHLVFNGHDHFYARSWPIGLYRAEGSHGVIFVTTAGGGAPLYRTRPRDYIASAIPLHHFVVMESNGDELMVSAYNVGGRVLDRFTVRKQKRPDGFFCWESEMLRESIRRALSELPSMAVSGRRNSLHGELVVPHEFRVPLQARLSWNVPPGWRLSSPEATVAVRPGQPLRIALRAEVHAEATHLLPRLNIELEAVKQSNQQGREAYPSLPFRNRSLTLYPFKLVGPESYRLTRVRRIEVDGCADDVDWQQAAVVHLPRVGFGSMTSGMSLLSLVPMSNTSPTFGRAGIGPFSPSASATSPEVKLATALESPPEVRLAINDDQLLALVRVRDKHRRISVKARDSQMQSSALALYDTHCRLELYDGQQLYSFAVSAENVFYHSVDGKLSEDAWIGCCAHDGQSWTTEFGIPLRMLGNRRQWRGNVVVFLKDGSVQYEWRSQRPILADTEILPTWDWRGASDPKTYARLVWPD